MKIIIFSTLISLSLISITNVNAASIFAGKAKAAAICSQCHGLKKTSDDAPFPPLAGRDQDSIVSALKQYRDKTRVSEIMNAFAGSLTDRDINNIAAYYSRLKSE
ncbi:MAG: cytochrome c [Methylococcales bacterium]|nr:cytochrome c [Methylococcales bacterium]